MFGHQWISTAQVPDGVALHLMRLGAEFTIFLDRNELMSTRASGSEEALATMTCARLAGLGPAQLLIGGYGLGFTLRAALAALDHDADVTVAELVPEIIEWARGPMRDLTAGCLDDTRVLLVNDDIAMLIDAARDGYDAILLDVDNGPNGLTRPDNDHLYGGHGLRAAMTALKPGGILAVWSAETDAAFTERLLKAGFDVEEVAVPEMASGDGVDHVIWFARKP
jgi:spermidine synthase